MRHDCTSWGIETMSTNREHIAHRLRTIYIEQSHWCNIGNVGFMKRYWCYIPEYIQTASEQDYRFDTLRLQLSTDRVIYDESHGLCQLITSEDTHIQ